MVLATAIFFAAISVWLRAPSADTLIVSLAFVASLVFTTGSFLWTGPWRRPASETFLYSQSLFDLFLVTAAVHVTWNGSQSEFAPLYILVIAVSPLLLPPSGVPLIASLGIILYIGDAIIGHDIVPGASLFFQLTVFAAVALTSGIIAARLRAAGVRSDEMEGELAQLRIRDSDIRTLEIRSQRLEGIAEMSASLAHEIRNPLASIRSAVEQLSRMPRASEDEQLLSTLVQRESDRLARLLSEFLDFARTNTAAFENLDLTEIARNAARLAAANPDMPTGVRLAEDFPESPLMLQGDEDLLHRAVYNLLLNSIQASPPNGRVRISGAELARHQLPPGRPEFDRGAVAIFIADDGPGVEPQIRDRLFDPFVTTKPGGSGLGLSIVQRAAEAHGGLVMVSDPGEQTRFTLVLPRFR